MSEIDSLRKALKRAADMLHSIAGDIEDGYALADMRGKYVLAVLGARDAAHDALRASAQSQIEEAGTADTAVPLVEGQPDTNNSSAIEHMEPTE